MAMLRQVDELNEVFERLGLFMQWEAREVIGKELFMVLIVENSIHVLHFITEYHADCIIKALKELRQSYPSWYSIPKRNILQCFANYMRPDLQDSVFYRNGEFFYAGLDMDRDGVLLDALHERIQPFYLTLHEEDA